MRARAAQIRSQMEKLAEELAILEKAASDLDAVHARSRAGRKQDEASKLSKQESSHTGNVGQMGTSARAMAISKARNSGNPLIDAANAAGYTLSTLSDAVSQRLGRRFHRSRMTLAMSGLRGMRPEIAEIIRELTKSESFPNGFDAWPRRTL